MNWQGRFNLILDINHLINNRTAVLFDQQHYLDVSPEGNNLSPNPSYGNATRYLTPRTFRLGVEIDL
ncbi:MAG: hypothetical protein K9J16_12785 [Melioribacteraceae bacterium]|nr:hypothetical protein [Melioribacteraceae bacterium]MCF8354732.1 hypothetical protein [Melioribacteraceae bacterium]MCF8394361.1 hypothetical protein [Melioribacteraceae bacterium]MCF8420071.1 hypothetical protein [Melioribacteraceae bacterium]